MHPAVYLAKQPITSKHIWRRIGYRKKCKTREPSAMNSGRCTELHVASSSGSKEWISAVLSRGSIDINQPDTEGKTPLSLAAKSGSTGSVDTLLNNGADVQAKARGSWTALHVSAFFGHQTVSSVLIDAGAIVDAVDDDGNTPLTKSARKGHVEGTVVLLMAGANVNHRLPCGTTPLFTAAEEGNLVMVKVLLQANADPMLGLEKDGGNFTFMYQSSFLPLDMAAQNRHIEVLRELLDQFGAKCCGGESEGILALLLASKCGHSEAMVMLLDAGVVDDGEALSATLKFGREESVKILLERQTSDMEAYVSTRPAFCKEMGYANPLLDLFHPNSLRPFSRRIMRRLLDAGAKPTAAFPNVRCKDGQMIICNDLKQYADFLIVEAELKKGNGSEEKMHGLKGLRCLLLQEEAVHAVSWLWVNSACSNAVASKIKKTGTKTKKLRWKRTTQSHALSAALTR